jgi:formylglycine-generating enzyme required for sulfatase activity
LGGLQLASTTISRSHSSSTLALSKDRLRIIPQSRLLEAPVRAGLGLPEHLVDSDDRQSAQYYLRFLSVDIAELAAKVESLEIELFERLAVGALLGLLGDPRIAELSPEMCDVEAGTWSIGISLTRAHKVAERLAPLGVQFNWIAKEAPRFSVSLGAYRIAKYPVTNSEYRAFLLDTGRPELPTSWAFGRYPQENSNHPVYSVTPAAADAYGRWLAKKTGRPFRLPTEIEWEVAAGGGEREYPWGDEFDPMLCNTAELALLTTTPVGSFAAGKSLFGALDMAGNVEEIVADNYAPYPGASHIQDDLSKNGPYRMTRGGAFTRFQDLTRCSRRHGWLAHSLYPVGFRVAESV